MFLLSFYTFTTFATLSRNFILHLSHLFYCFYILYTNLNKFQAFSLYYLFSSFSSHYYSYALELIAQNRYTSYYICKSKPISFSKHVFKFHSILLTYPKSTQNISVTIFNVSFVLLWDSRLSSKLMFQAKLDSEIVDFSNNF